MERIRKHFIAIVLILLASQSVLANSGDWLSEKVLNEEEVYSSTKEACLQIPTRNLYGGLEFDNLYAGIFPSNKFNSLIQSIFSEEFKKNTIYLLEEGGNENELWLLNSPSFNKALVECYKDSKDRKQFKKLVSNRKRAGFSVGFLTSFLAIGKGLNIIGKAAPKVTRYFDKALFAAIIGSLSYSSLYNLNKKIQVRLKCGNPAPIDCLLAVLNKSENEDLKNSIKEDLSNDLIQIQSHLSPTD
jgi:hypothetical protein